MSKPAKPPVNGPAQVDTNARPWIIFGAFWIVMIFVGFGG